MRRTWALVAGVLAVAAVVAPAVRAEGPQAPAWEPRAATYGITVDRNVAIEMSDGVVLDADVYFPANPDGSKATGPFPVALVQTPYNKSVQNPADEYLVSRGYVDVVVDIRGTGGSEGVFDQTFSTRSQLDGKELVEWAASQPWSTGRVGLHGESYYAINQLLTAAQQPKGLAAIFPVVPTGDNYRTNFPGGYLTSLFVVSLLDAAYGSTPPGYLGDDPLRALRTLGSRPASVLLQAENSAGLLAGDARSYDGPGYAAISPLAMLDRIQVPTFVVGGWYDALSQRDGPLLFQGLRARNVPVKLLMGPWYHTTPGEGLPADGIPSLDALRLRWFDRWVAGRADPGMDTFGPVVYHREGEGRYHVAPHWPVPGVRWQRAHLGAGGTLGPAPGSGDPDLLPWQPASGPCSRSTYVGTFGLAPSTPCETDDSLNDRTGLVYELPVEEDLTLAGPVSARLFVSTTTTDAFVTLHLSDVDPVTGVATELTGGWDSLAFRALDEERSAKVGDDYVIPYHPYTEASVQPAEAGKVYEWWVEIRPLAARIPAGHRLRLSVQTSDTVRFLPTAPRLQGAVGSVVKLHHDAEHPSAVVLPVAPN